MHEVIAKWHEYERCAFSKLKALYDNAREKWRSPSSTHALLVWLLSTIALIVSVSLVVSTGPHIQNYIFSLIYNDAASIYGSAYQDGLAKFPEVQQWMMAGLQWPFLLIATIVVCISLRHPTARQLFISSGATSFLALMTFDLLSGVIDNTISAGYVIQNIIANVVGGALLAFTLVTIISAANICFIHLQGPKMWRQLVAGLAIVIVGICLNAATFYVAEFFYRPVPVRIDVVFDYPVFGAISTDAHNAGDKEKHSQTNVEEENRSQPFKFFPKDIHDAAIHWKSSADESEFLAEWGALSKSYVFDATIELYADCLNGKFDITPSSAGNVIRIDNVNNFSVSLDKGWSQFSTVNPPRMSGRLDTKFGSHVLFQLDGDADAKRIEITQFVDKSAAMTIVNEGRQLSFFVNAPLAASVGEGIARSGRTLSFKINGKNYSIESEKPQVAAEDAELVCQPLAPNGAFEQDRVTIVGSRSYFGALIRVSRRPLPNSIYGIQDNELKVLGGIGWVTLTRPREETSSYDNSGTVNLLAFGGNVASLDVDRSPVSARPIDRYVATGELAGHFESSAKVRFIGLAKALWKNGSRMNPTKWERLSWEKSLFILTMILTIFAPIARYVVIQIRNDSKIDWLSNFE